MSDVSVRIIDEVPASSSRSSRSQQDSDTKILLTFEESTCSYCTKKLKVGRGIMIQDCLHAFCKMCLSTWLKSASSLDVNCPMECGGKLCPSEIKVLLGVKGFDNLEKKACQVALQACQNIFKCQAPKCQGLFEVDEAAKVYLCPLCNVSNCISCKAIHGEIACEEYQEEKRKCSEMPNGEKVLRDFVEKRSGSNGLQQFVAAVAAGTLANRRNRGSNDYGNVITSMANRRLVTSTREFECIICYADVPAGEGVILQECFHMFCKGCLISHIEHNTDPQVRCPQPNCTSYLLPREIHALLPPEILAKVVKRSWTLAESVISSKFHCLTADCDGFCELDGNVNAFQCPLCLKTNCISCNAIHENVTCEDYKNRIEQNENDAQSAKALDNLIATGKAMKCTKCNAVVQKEAGCDWIVCVMCKTQLCWVTKGPRWGPNGQGDTSGGCRCRVGGKLCHPKCGNCH